MIGFAGRQRFLVLAVVITLAVIVGRWTSIDTHISARYESVRCSGWLKNWCSQPPELDDEPAQQIEDPHRKLIGGKPRLEALPPTKVIRHVPGTTVFENLYMHDGVLFIVSDEQSSFPEIRKIISTPMEISGDPENVRGREPGPRVMTHISLSDARRRWGDRVFRLQGVTWFIQDVPQFLRHYYHFAAETFLMLWRVYASLDSNISNRGETVLDQPSRIMFPHCDNEQWRGGLLFNRMILQGAFPSASIETNEDWTGMCHLSLASKGGEPKVWRFEQIVIEDGSAGYRDKIAPEIGRVSAESVEGTQQWSSPWWWEPVRRAFCRAAGVSDATLDMNLWMEQVAAGENGVVKFKDEEHRKNVIGRMPITITYIVRRGERRVLHDEDHKALVDGLNELCKKRHWGLNIVSPEEMDWDAQIRLAARTTIMISVHGNGLTHSLWMPRTPVSAVFEISHPGVFYNHYEWTVRRALGFKHYLFWNDKILTWPEHKKQNFEIPDWKGMKHPSHPPTILKQIEAHVDGRT